MYIHRQTVVVPLKLQPTTRFIAESLFQLETREVYNVVDDDPEDEVRCCCCCCCCCCCSFLRGTLTTTRRTRYVAVVLFYVAQPNNNNSVPRAQVYYSTCYKKVSRSAFDALPDADTAPPPPPAPWRVGTRCLSCETAISAPANGYWEIADTCKACTPAPIAPLPR